MRAETYLRLTVYIVGSLLAEVCSATGQRNRNSVQEVVVVDKGGIFIEL